ncbi:MAG: MarR family winged helix-turn-helix transcriptional regulator [Chloroflexota bacterium]|nr:MarR family winged helix-turn-helix transcriptional regulator [Dehalococcoidia bacterium]MDW8255344.1 MarR family winged helix-turn-helix transcriptional regulator [Chloroflexota bacterium]
MDADSLEAGAGPIAARLATALAKIGLALKSRGWREAGPRGLSPTQAQILVQLRRGPASLAAVAAALGVTPPTASDAVAALERKGFVSKRVAPEDGRAIRIALTAAGREEAERAAGWPDFLAAAAETLAPEEQAVFLRALIKLIRELQERGEIPLSAMCVSCVFFRPNVHPDPRRPHHCAFVDAPFGDSALRLDCPDFQLAPPEARQTAWLAFAGGSPPR